MKKVSFACVAALLVVSMSVCGCGGSGSGSGSNLSCSLKVAGQQFCYAYSKLSSGNASSARSMCSNQGGSIVDSCPTEDLVGCCALTQNGLPYQSCYYFGTASTDKMGCIGTWTDGSAALGEGGGTTTDGTKTSGTTDTSTTGGCVTGDAGCPCYPNKTCNGSLTCVSGICAYDSAIPSTTNCAIESSGRLTQCLSYSKLSPDDAASLRAACMIAEGEMVDSCPSAGLVGCCALSDDGRAYQSCYYSGTASAAKAECSGSWTDGSAALQGDGGGGKTNTSTSTATNTATSTTTSTTTTCASGDGLCCPDNYCTLGQAHGYAFAYSDSPDGGLSSASLNTPDRLCVDGTAVGASCSTQSCFNKYWGGGIGINLNQAEGDDTAAESFTAADSDGVTYAISGMVSGMRIVVGDSTTDYCVNLTSASGTVPWGAFNSACWGDSGRSLSGPPGTFTSIRFQVVADALYDTDTDFDFCVTKLSF